MREEVGREEGWANAEAGHGWMDRGVGDSGPEYDATEES
jgi:hypothetical protein